MRYLMIRIMPAMDDPIEHVARVGHKNDGIMLYKYHNYEQAISLIRQWRSWKDDFKAAIFSVRAGNVRFEPTGTDEREYIVQKYWTLILEREIYE